MEYNEQEILDVESTVKEEVEQVKTTIEFKVIKQINGEVLFNFEENKKILNVKLENYRNYPVTLENLATANKDLASLRKVIKFINDERIRIKKEVLKQYSETFEPNCNKLVDMIRECETSIASKIKEFEDAADELKKKVIENYFNSLDFKLITLSQIENNKWLNTTFKMKDIQAEIDTRINEIRQGLEVIEGTIPDVNSQLEVKAEYLKTLNLATAISNWKKREEMKKRVAQFSTPTSEKPTEIKAIYQERAVLEQTPKEEYEVTFKVKATESRLMQLSAYLKANDYNYKQIKEEE